MGDPMIAAFKTGGFVMELKTVKMEAMKQKTFALQKLTFQDVTPTPNYAVLRPEDVIKAWGLMAAAAPQFRKIETFLYDLVDITRQGLANTAPMFYNKIQKAYREKKSILYLHENSLVFTDLLKDLELILSSNENFMLGPWL